MILCLLESLWFMYYCIGVCAFQGADIFCRFYRLILSGKSLLLYPLDWWDCFQDYSWMRLRTRVWSVVGSAVYWSVNRDLGRCGFCIVSGDWDRTVSVTLVKWTGTVTRVYQSIWVQMAGLFLGAQMGVSLIGSLASARSLSKVPLNAWTNMFPGNSVGRKIV